ncbi:MAG: hypothetical protein ACYCZF_09420 [Anaerolineae bacterium]
MNASNLYLIVPCQAVPDLPDHLRITYALILGLAYGKSDGATPPITRRELGDLRQLSPRAIDAHLAALRRAGYVRNAPERDGLPLVLIPRPLPGMRALSPLATELAPAPTAEIADSDGSNPSSRLNSSSSEENLSSYSLLVRAGVYPAIAVTLSQRPWITPELVQAWVTHLRGERQVRHLGGLLASILRRGDIGMPPPPVPDNDDDDDDAAVSVRSISRPDLTPLGKTWLEMKDHLIECLPQLRLENWLAESVPLAWDGLYLLVGTRSSLAADYLSKRNTLVLNRTLGEFLGQPIFLSFRQRPNGV